MNVVITRLFDSYEHASQAVTELEASGIPASDVSIVANNVEGRYGPGTTPGTTPGATPGTTPGTTADERTYEAEAPSDAGAGAGTGATIGTVLGGGAGLLTGLGMLAIPGVGPVVAAGWLIATAVGAGVGAGAGGLLGSLVGAGVDESEAHVYAEGVRRGGTLVTARVDDSQRATVEEVMARFNAVDASTRGEEYRASGWERFDESAPPAYAAGAAPDLGVAPTTTTAPGLAPGLGPNDPRTRL